MHTRSWWPGACLPPAGSASRFPGNAGGQKEPQVCRPRGPEATVRHENQAPPALGNGSKQETHKVSLSFATHARSHREA